MKQNNLADQKIFLIIIISNHDFLHNTTGIFQFTQFALKYMFLTFKLLNQGFVEKVIQLM